MTFTPRQIDNWREFERVRSSGMFNMASRQALQASGLERDEYMFCVKNYFELESAAMAEGNASK